MSRKGALKCRKGPSKGPPGRLYGHEIRSDIRSGDTATTNAYNAAPKSIPSPYVTAAAAPPRTS
ncbi:hypothetical protein GCM10017674_20450 [Streptomyces gardneri]|nr:hypothetical protein GCM10017674_20450 [Streptomyces gardneri]